MKKSTSREVDSLLLIGLKQKQRKGLDSIENLMGACWLEVMNCP